MKLLAPLACSLLFMLACGGAKPAGDTKPSAQVTPADKTEPCGACAEGTTCDTCPGDPSCPTCDVCGPPVCVPIAAE